MGPIKHVVEYRELSYHQRNELYYDMKFFKIIRFLLFLHIFTQITYFHFWNFLSPDAPEAIPDIQISILMTGYMRISRWFRQYNLIYGDWEALIIYLQSPIFNARDHFVLGGLISSWFSLNHIILWVYHPTWWGDWCEKPLFVSIPYFNGSLIRWVVSNWNWKKHITTLCKRKNKFRRFIILKYMEVNLHE